MLKQSFVPFFMQLADQVGHLKNVKLNNYALGDKVGKFYYNEGHQAIENKVTSITVKVHTLDWYVQRNKIRKIDFLKMDVEGYELNVLKGGLETIKKCRYIQYETGTNDEEIEKILKKDFDLTYIGTRNMFCVRKGEEKPWFPTELKEGNLLLKNEDNRLRNI